MITFLGFFPFKKDIIGFLLWIDSIAYRIFSTIYKIFLSLAQYQIFEIDAFKDIYDNLYTIIGVIALFVISFLLLQMLVNPEENKGSKQIRDIILRFVVAMAGIVLLPTFFGFLMDFQNSIISYGVLPKVLLENKIYIQNVDENGNYGELKEEPISKTELSSLFMEQRANYMTSMIIGGLMYPLNDDGSYIEPIFQERGTDEETGEVIGYYVYMKNTGDEWHTNVSEWWTTGTKVGTGLIGCAVGLVGLVIFTVATYGAGAALSIGGGTAAIACLAAGAAPVLVGSAVAAVDATKYTWTNALQGVQLYGDFSKITLFAQAIANGEFHYTAIISTIAIGFLVYIMLGFCIDLVVRSGKLFLYQLLAPLCFLMSVIPSKKDLIGKWFKIVISTWLEIFIRVAVVCLVVLFVGKIDFTTITSWTHPFTSAFIIVGLVIFTKQIPKLFKDLTGIDTGNMKLGLKDKLKEGGLFTAGAAIGGGVTALTRNAVNKWGNKENWKNKKGNVTFGSVAKNLGAGLFSGAAGGLSGAFRSGKSGLNAKGFGDMKTSASKGAKDAVAARVDRAKYKADKGGTIGGVLVGRYNDAIESAKKYVGIEPDYSALQAEQASSDALLQSVKEAGNISEDYIKKHQYEFYVGLNEKQQDALDNLRLNLEKEQDVTKKADIENQIEKLVTNAGAVRLDLLEAEIKAAEKTGNAKAIADATNKYNKAFKDIKDGFVTRVHTHVGAEKEAVAISAIIDDTRAKLSEEVNSRAVSMLHTGYKDANGVEVVKSQTEELTKENAAKFFKQMKNASEVTNAEIAAERQRLERKQKKKENK